MQKCKLINVIKINLITKISFHLYYLTITLIPYYFFSKNISLHNFMNKFHNKIRLNSELKETVYYFISKFNSHASK